MVNYQIGQTLRVEFWKYPADTLHYWWEAQVYELREEGVLVYMPLGFEFHHVSKNRLLRLDHQAYVAFFVGRWYSGGPDLDAEGSVLEYYWNIQTPPRFEPDRIWQYDLEIDVKCKADHTCQAFDLEEFATKAPLYPAEWVEQATQAVQQVERHVRRQQWPVLPPGKGRSWLER
jgi:protein associated with RNAse G/E